MVLGGEKGRRGKRRRTPRVRNSIGLFGESRPRAEEMKAAQEVVRSVVVLLAGKATC